MLVSAGAHIMSTGLRSNGQVEKTQRISLPRVPREMVNDSVEQDNRRFAAHVSLRRQTTLPKST